MDLLLISLMLHAPLPAMAQQAPADAPASSPAPTASTPATPPVSTPAAAAASTTDESGPSPATLKRARNLGLKPEWHNGQMMFCWEDASIGSRITTKKCTDETGLADILAQREAVKALMRQSATGTAH
jgi:hypothetical protein